MMIAFAWLVKPLRRRVPLERGVGRSRYAEKAAMLSRIHHGTSPPHPRDCSKRTMRLPQDGNVVRSDIQAELRAPPAAPEAQRAATKDDRSLLTRHPPHRRALRPSN